MGNDRSILLTTDQGKSKNTVGNISVPITRESANPWYNQDIRVWRKILMKQEKEAPLIPIISGHIFSSFSNGKEIRNFQFAFSMKTENFRLLDMADYSSSDQTKNAEDTVHMLCLGHSDKQHGQHFCQSGIRLRSDIAQVTRLLSTGLPGIYLIFQAFPGLTGSCSLGFQGVLYRELWGDKDSVGERIMEAQNC